MAEFYGFSTCVLDGNGRLKLPELFLAAFASPSLCDSNRIMFYLLPEGCLAIFPYALWHSERQTMQNEAGSLLFDAGQRAKQRELGYRTQEGEISKQGRITIPAMMRAELQLQGGENVIVNGAVDYVEIWQEKTWKTSRPVKI